MSSLECPTNVTSDSATKVADTTLQTRPSTVIKPVPFFHPTRARFQTLDALDQPPTAEWSSRSSRKNRIQRETIQAVHKDDEGERGGAYSIEAKLWHLEGQLKPHLSWDISFWVALIFVLGSAAWVVNGFLLLLPLIGTGTPSQNFDQAQWWAFAGGTLFEIGAYLMVVEALNSGHEDLFGPALWDLIENHEQEVDEKATGGKGQTGPSGKGFRWIGIGNWRDIGFMGTFIQFIAASVFWIATITGIPGVIPNFTSGPPVAITDIFFWTPQVIGGTGFIIASTLFMLEVQIKWWKPNVASIGWHIGLWNLIGAIGFTLCGALGYAALSSSKVNYQSVLCTFWGGWAFLIGSAAQLWETLWREDPDTAAGSAKGEVKY